MACTTHVASFRPGSARLPRARPTGPWPRPENDETGRDGGDITSDDRQIPVLYVVRSATHANRLLARPWTDLEGSFSLMMSEKNLRNTSVER